MNCIVLLVIFIVNLASAEECVDNEPVIENCRKYYKCDQNGNKREFLCPYKLYYNCLSKKCENSFSPACCQNDLIIMRFANKILSKYCKTNKVTIKSPYSCGKYYICINHKYVGRQCENNKEFDNILGKCTDRNCENSRRVITGPKEIISVPMQSDENVSDDDGQWIPIDGNSGSESNEYVETTQSSTVITSTDTTTDTSVSTSASTDTDTNLKESPDESGSTEDTNNSTSTSEGSTSSTEESTSDETTTEESTTVLTSVELTSASNESTSTSDESSSTSDESTSTSDESTLTTDELTSISDETTTNESNSDEPLNGTESSVLLPVTHAPDIVDELETFLKQFITTLKYYTNLVESIASGLTILTDVFGYKELEDTPVTNSTEITTIFTDEQQTNSDEQTISSTASSEDSDETIDIDEAFRDSTANRFTAILNGSIDNITVSLSNQSKNAGQILVKKAKNVVILVN